jgi:hypothetical protein
MGIPVGYTTVATERRTTEFTCARCGIHRKAEIVGVGEGAQSFLNSRGTAERRARIDAVRDVDRTIGRARCPGCHQRNPGAVFRFWLPYLIMVAICIGAGILMGYYPTWSDMNMRDGDKAGLREIVPWVVGVPCTLITLLVGWSRWARTDKRVTWLP